MPPFDQPGIGSILQGPIDQQSPQEPAGFQEPTSNLGAQLQPQPQPNDSLRGEWDAWFTDPANRAGMMSFGLNLLSGGFGTPLQQFAHAAGQGLESAAGAATFQQQQERLDARENFRERQLAQRGQIAAANRQSREKIASDLAKARVSSAGLSGSNANKAISLWSNTYLNTLKDPFFTGTDEEKQAKATADADKALQSLRGAFPGGGIPGGQTSPNLPAGGGPAQSPQAPPAAGQTSPNSQRELIPLESLSNSPNFQRALELDKTPEGRQRLIERGIKPSSGPQSQLGSPTSSVAQGLLATNPIAGPMALGNFVGQNATEGILKLLQGGGQ